MRRLILALACAVVLVGAAGCSSTGDATGDGLSLNVDSIIGQVSDLAAKAAVDEVQKRLPDEQKLGDAQKDAVRKVIKDLLSEWIGKAGAALAPKE